MTLEEQIETLASLGLPLSQQVTIEDLLASADREVYEKTPFNYILFMYGVEAEREPWGRKICPVVWNFDTECIDGTGSYVNIVQQLSDLSQQSELLTNVEDHVNFRTGRGWLAYEIEGKQRRWEVEVNSDWVDPRVISYVVDDLSREGKQFYAIDNGQSSILFYLDAAAASRLLELSEYPLDPYV